MMGTQRVQMKGVLPWLVHWACRACHFERACQEKCEKVLFFALFLQNYKAAFLQKLLLLKKDSLPNLNFRLSKAME
jgi:hypothetical protein